MRHSFLKYTVTLVVFTVCLLFCGCDREETDSSTYSGNTENAVSAFGVTDNPETVTENAASVLTGGSGESEKADGTDSLSEKTEVTIEPEAVTKDDGSSDLSSITESSEILSGEQAEDDLVSSSHDNSGINPWDTDGDGYYDFKIH